MPSKFIGKDITVQTAGEPKLPVSFRFDGQDFIIAEVVEWWPDHGYGKSHTGRKRWWQRHHRNYYRVRTENDTVYEIYYDRGVNLKHPDRKKWFLTREIIS